MKKIASIFQIFLVVLFFTAFSHSASTTENLWTKYASKVRPPTLMGSKETPGRIIGAIQANELDVFIAPWKFRKITYELHYANQMELASAVFSLAVHAGDVEPSISSQRFYAGVQGFHYSTEQICTWMNDVFAGRFRSPESSEIILIGYLIQDNVIVVRDGMFVPSDTATHVLAAAPGKKRTFLKNLLHERAHVVWDEDQTFRLQAEALWNKMTPEETEQVRASLKQYAQRPSLLIKEWAVRELENGRLKNEALNP
jgi:hypothetical protein